MALLEAIQALSKTDDRGKPVFDLPFKFTWACSRTLSKLREGLAPLEERNAKVFDGWPELQKKLEAKLKSKDPKVREAAGLERQRELTARNKAWNAVLREDIEVEVYPFPKWDKDQWEQIEAAGLTADLLSHLDPMDFQPPEEAAA